jgi:redox-sensitive bicupin YhaK (pirin superfamily)
MSVIKEFKSNAIPEGAGVVVNRVFGYHDTKEFDPFLMLDYLSSEKGSLSAGFPWHPHRGIETITYLIKGKIQHEDSLGNKAVINDGDVQWMSAGSGVMHQEMPGDGATEVQGFQFWLNMPANEKMNAPTYTEIKSDEMVIVEKEQVTVKVIAGTYKGVKGPIQKERQKIDLLHVSLAQGAQIELNRDEFKQGFIFLFEGQVVLEGQKLNEGSAYTLSEGVQTLKASTDVELIFAQGEALNEPIAWGGPIVMNTKEELRKAFEELNNGEFI